MKTLRPPTADNEDPGAETEGESLRNIMMWTASYGCRRVAAGAAKKSENQPAQKYGGPKMVPARRSPIYELAAWRTHRVSVHRIPERGTSVDAKGILNDNQK